MSFTFGSIHVQASDAVPSGTPVPEEEEFYSSWSLFLVCLLLIVSLWTSYYLQIKRIRAIHETLVAILAGMFVGLVVRLAPGTMIREMLVSSRPLSIPQEYSNSYDCLNSIVYSTFTNLPRMHSRRRLLIVVSISCLRFGELMSSCPRHSSIPSFSTYSCHQSY